MKKHNFLIIFIFGLLLCFNLDYLYAYTQQEYNIYKEVMDTPMSISEEKIHKKLALKYGTSKGEIEKIVKKVMHEIYFKDETDKEKIRNQIEEIFSNKAKIKTLIVSGDFANIGYIEAMLTWDEKDVTNKVTKIMPEYLEKLFKIAEINKIRLTAYYPTTNGEQMKVASLEVEREEFHKEKMAKGYENFWNR